LALPPPAFTVSILDQNQFPVCQDDEVRDAQGPEKRVAEQSKHFYTNFRLQDEVDDLFMGQQAALCIAHEFVTRPTEVIELGPF
jgi:hypothetical protein